jgi:hypothetical protein
MNGVRISPVTWAPVAVYITGARAEIVTSVAPDQCG